MARHRRRKCKLAQQICIAINRADLECILGSQLRAGFGARSAVRNHCCLYISTYSAQICSLREQSNSNLEAYWLASDLNSGMLRRGELSGRQVTGSCTLRMVRATSVGKRAASGVTSHVSAKRVGQDEKLAVGSTRQISTPTTWTHLLGPDCVSIGAGIKEGSAASETPSSASILLLFRLCYLQEFARAGQSIFSQSHCPTDETR